MPEVRPRASAHRAPAPARPTAAGAQALSSRSGRGERDEQGAEVLDQQRGPRSRAGGSRGSRRAGRERPRTRRTRRGVRQLAPVRSRRALRPGHEEDERRRPIQRAGAAHLGQPQRREPRLEDHLRGAVPFSAKSVPAPRAIAYPIAGRRSLVYALGGDGGDVAHGAAGYPPTLSERDVAQPGQSAALWEAEAARSNRAVPTVGLAVLRRRRGAHARLPRERSADPAGHARADDRCLLARGLPGRPLGELRLITLAYRGFDGRDAHGRLVANRTPPRHSSAVFRRLYAARFPIRRMEPVDVYGGDDYRSIEADNTSAFNCRAATGSSTGQARLRPRDRRQPDREPVRQRRETSHSASAPVSRPLPPRAPGWPTTGGMLVEAFRRRLGLGRSWPAPRTTSTSR